MVLGFQRSRVVMINEAHSGLRRCARTRKIGKRILPAAHTAGVRYLAMEALFPEFAEEANSTRNVPRCPGGYLAQHDMRELIAAALDGGWTLVPYEADIRLKPPEFAHLGREETNWREDQQARNLVSILEGFQDDRSLLVWCGNGHLTKCAVGEWLPMGLRFSELSGIDPFAIDQIASVEFGDRESYAAPWVERYATEIEALGGAAGFLSEEAPANWSPRERSDAFVLSVENALS